MPRSTQKRSQRVVRAKLRTELENALGPEYLNAAAYRQRMEEDARAAGYAKGYIIRRVMPGGERVAIVSSAGIEAHATYFPADTGQHHNALLASIYHANMRAALSDG